MPDAPPDSPWSGTRADRWRRLALRRSIPIALLATGVALLENTVLPWAPYHVLHAVGITALSLWLGTGSFRVRGVGPLVWAAALLGPYPLQLATGAWIGQVFPALLRLAGVGPDAAASGFWSFPVAFGEIFVHAGERLGGSPATHQSLYLGFVIAWAGLGEELFYRGYLHESLRPRFGSAGTVLLAAGLFGLRHATQFGLLAPDYPWGAAASWVLFSGAVGAFLGVLYERSGSLVPAIAAHYLFNLIPFLVA